MFRISGPVLLWYVVIQLAPVAMGSGAPVLNTSKTLDIPRVQRAPKLEDFEHMRPAGAATELRRVSEFIQNQPSDGQPATERTEGYLGYDDTNLYVVLVCWDDKHQGVRASLTRREPSTPFDSDDYVEITLDTFQDQRHAFVFDVNPRGVQADALWTEGEGPDYSWDTLWYSRATINSDGYIVWAAIPFRSLRFHPMEVNRWGVTLTRYLARNAEYDNWPWISARISGRLSQEGTLTGFDHISPGRNMQFIPYVESRTFRALDTRDPCNRDTIPRVFRARQAWIQNSCSMTAWCSIPPSTPILPRWNRMSRKIR